MCVHLEPPIALAILPMSLGPQCPNCDVGTLIFEKANSCPPRGSLYSCLYPKTFMKQTWPQCRGNESQLSTAALGVVVPVSHTSFSYGQKDMGRSFLYKYSHHRGVNHGKDSRCCCTIGFLFDAELCCT